MNISSPARQQPCARHQEHIYDSRTIFWISCSFSTSSSNASHFRCSKLSNPTLLCSLLATDWTVRNSNPAGGEVFRTCAERLWGPPSLLYNGYGVFPGVNRPRRGVDHPPPSSAEVKERVDLYIYSLSGPSWPVVGWTLPFTFTLLCSSEPSYDECLSLCIIHAYSGAALFTCSFQCN